MKLVLLLMACFAIGVMAAEKPKAPAKPAEHTLPYLGPGADKMTPEEYDRVYKNYIQTSILLGYPITRDLRAPCDQALNNIFRQMGMFGYPVPGEAQQLTRNNKVVKGFKVETYAQGGALIQVVRDGKKNGLLKLILVNSASPRATLKLTQLARNDIIDLDRDPKTGLERVKGVPVGYPHPFLSKEAQGLFVKTLRFNGKVDGCEPVEFLDNAWTGGFELSENRCVELQNDATSVWDGRMPTEEFYKRELGRMKQRGVKEAMKSGIKEDEALDLVNRHYTLPLTSEISVVGSAMANLAQCNLVALGNAGARAKNAAPAGTSDGGQGTPAKGAGSAE
ncbi:MAG: hypothetical protein ACXWQO_18340 [Bdellovibrionota bacterium]